MSRGERDLFDIKLLSGAEGSVPQDATEPAGMLIAWQSLTS